MRGLFLLLAVFLGIYVFKRWADKAGPVQTQRLLRKIAIGLGIVLLLFLLSRGGPAAALLLPLLLPVLLNARSLWRRFAPAGSPGGTQSSQTQSAVETEYLRMSLDHTSGDMQGTVLKGHFAGRELAELNFQELAALWRECRQDAQSVSVLEAYMDRTQDENWREHVHEFRQSSDNSRHTGPMDEKEAYEILGLQAGASPEEIKSAHRRLMQHLHPDHGGSAYLAVKLNQAKDLLLGGK